MDFPCRLCGHDELTLAYTVGNHDEFAYYRCPRCQLVNYDLRGGLDQGKYERDYVDPRQDDHPVFARRDQTHAFLSRHLRPPGALLDIGCGFGRLLHLARRDGWQVTGLELSPLLAERARAALEVEVHVADFLRDPVPGPYDLVVMTHVLEHLPDSLLAMRRIHALLRPGGRAILEFPNIDGLDLRIKRALRRWGLHRKRYPDGFVPGHCNEFCRTSFAYLLAQTGFTLLQWQTYSSSPAWTPLYAWSGFGNKARVLIARGD